MTLPVAPNLITLQDVNVELGLSPTAPISLNDAAVRTLFGVPSGPISLSDGHGKANVFTFNITTNQTNANLRTLALNAGWNGTVHVTCTINGGVVCSGNTVGNSTAAFTINGSFPAGVRLVNNGSIRGRGGNGGGGGGVTGNGGGGGTGGRALLASVAVTVDNNATIGAGGGGGGGFWCGRYYRE